MEEKKKQFFIDYKMLGIIFSLAWPTMLGELMQTAVQYIDTAMVGSLGTKATAAVGATSTVNWLVGSTVSALGVGFLAFISQSIGAKKTEQAKDASAQAVTVVLVVGILFTILTTGLSGMVPVWMQVDENIQGMASRYFFILYTVMLFRTANTIFGTILRASGDTKTPMRVGIKVNLINIILNFLLIYPTKQYVLLGLKIVIPGAGMGIQGAALSSAISYMYGGIAITRQFWIHDEISPKGHSLKPSIEILKPCFNVAIPNMFQRFATSLGYVVFASMINSLGDISTATHTIANTVESAFYIPGWGMQTAAATLSGQAFGGKKFKELTRLGRTIIHLEIGLMIISGGLLFIFAPQLMCIFSKDPKVINLGSTILRLVALSEPFYGVPIAIEGLLYGVGKTVTPFVFNICGMWGVRIVGTYICINFLGYGLISAWGCMIAHNLLLFVLFTVYYKLRFVPSISHME